MNIHIALWSQPNFRPINKFYRSQKHKGSASGNERVFFITDVANEDIIAAVRLVPHDGFYWLRSLYIKQEHRGQKLGSRLLAYVAQNIKMPIYCFPYDYLLHFYEQNDYILLNKSALPQALASLFERYISKGQNIICMVANHQNSTHTGRNNS